MAKRAQKGGVGAEAARIFWIVALSTGLGICVNSCSKHPLAIFQEPEKNASPISIEELVAALKRDEPLLLLDVRGQVEYDSEHAPSALHVPLESLMEKHPEIAPFLDGASLIVTLCDSEECAKAEEAAEMLAKLGYKNVRVLKGGWEAYRHTQLPRVTSVEGKQ